MEKLRVINLNKRKYKKIEQDFLKRYPMSEDLVGLSMFDIFEDREAERLKKQYEEFYKELEMEKLMEENKDADGFCDAPIK